jgi:sugar phosphate isomerase/epimerase
MRPILSTVSLHHHPWPQVLEVAAQSGFTEIELLMIPGWVHLDPEALSPSLLHEAFSARGLCLSGIHAGGIDGNSDAALTNSLCHIQQVVRIVGKAGGRFVNINGMPVPSGSSPAQRQEMLERIIRGLKILEPEIQSQGVTMTLENHVGCHLETVEDYRVIFRSFVDSSWLGATIDTGHFTAAGISPATAVRELSERVYHVHVKDHHEGRSVALGTGEIDNIGCIRALRAIGYSGGLSAELELSDAKSECQATHAAFSYLQHLISMVTETV